MLSLAEASGEARLGGQSRGNAPRLYRNTLVFLAADKTRLQDLDEAARRYLAWKSIVGDVNTLNLTPQQVRQAEEQKESADKAVTARLPETYQWLLVPAQDSPHAAVEWRALRLTGSDALAVRASKKLRSDELLIASFAGTRLRMDLDKIPLWRGDHVAIKQLADDFARYLYLPRLMDPSVLAGAVRDGVSLLTWDRETFALADSFDEAAGRYRGLRAGQSITLVDTDTPWLLLKPDVARRQLDADRAATPSGPSTSPPAGGAAPTATAPVGSPAGTPPSVATQPRRFHGTVDLDPTRVGRDASRIADEVDLLPN
jgi:hypothetical protein